MSIDSLIIIVRSGVITDIYNDYFDEAIKFRNKFYGLDKDATDEDVKEASAHSQDDCFLWDAQGLPGIPSPSVEDGKE